MEHLMNISLNTTRFLEECAGKWGEQQKGEEMNGNGTVDPGFSDDP